MTFKLLVYIFDWYILYQYKTSIYLIDSNELSDVCHLTSVKHDSHTKLDSYLWEMS